MVRIPKTATQVECNSSYFKLSIFEKAEVGCQNLEIESLESIVLKLRISYSPVKYIDSEEVELSKFNVRQNNCI